MDVCDVEVVSEAVKAADLEILTDGHDLLGHGLGNGKLLAGVLAVEKSVDIGGSVLEDDGGDVLDELDEQRTLGAEVGLAVDLDDGAGAALVADGRVGHTLGRDTAGLLCGLGKALFTQPVDCLIHIAVACGECLLAVHHADVGHLTESLYILSSKCHINLSSSVNSEKGAYSAPLFLF